MQKEALSVNEVVEITGLSRWLIRRAIEAGELNAIRPSARKILIPRWSLDQFLRKP